MIDSRHARGVVSMLVQRFEGQQLDRLLDMKAAVDAGQVLGDYDSDFLAQALDEARRSKHLVDEHPAYHPLYVRAIRLYREIVAKALENEQNMISGSGLEGMTASSPSAVERV